MKIIPAIDLYNGNVVRLYQGKKDQCKVYSNDPVSVARKWIEEGAELLHIVDLNASFDEGNNIGLIKEITGLGAETEVGGGVRTFNRAEKLFACGVTRLILGTKALDTDFLTTLIKTYNDKIAVSVDTSKGKVATFGWRTKTELTYLDFIQHLIEGGVRWIVYTDITKDGTLTGPSIGQMKKLSSFTGPKYIISGGVGAIKDLKLIKKELPFIYGAIVGRALYEKTITLKSALSLFK